jgi:hypothetical protein
MTINHELMEFYMEAKFTKCDLQVNDILDDSGKFSYPYPVDENCRDLFNQGPEEGRANAVLMTKAHKLYAALELVLKDAVNHSALDHIGQLAVNYAIDILSQARSESIPAA